MRRVPLEFRPSDLHGLFCWYRADKGVRTSGATVVQWDDLSGAGRHLTPGAPPKNQPTLSIPGAGGNFHKPYVSVNSGSLEFPTSAFSGITAIDGFVVFRRTINVGANTPWAIGPEAAGLSHFPFGTTLYDSFGTSVRKDDITIPSRLDPLNNFIGYEVCSATNDWACYINGQKLRETSSNTVSFDTNPKLGASTQTWYVGDFAEFIAYNRKLTNAERERIWTYFQIRYGIHRR